jgi:DNA mismatch repair protein MutS
MYLTPPCSNGEQQENIENMTQEIIEFLQKHFILEKCQRIQSMTSFEENIIQPGVNPLLDDMVSTYQHKTTTLNNIHHSLNRLIAKHENTDGKAPIEYVKIHETDKSGYSLQMTIKRSQMMKSIIMKEHAPFLTINQNEQIPFEQIKFSKSSSSMMELEFPFLHDLCKSILQTKEKINSLLTTLYQDILSTLKTKIHLLENLANFIAKFDVIQTKAYIAKQYHYCCPIIDTTIEKSFVRATELRHPLIEHIQENELYVANDIQLGNQDSTGYVDGILLYGTNAVGKTSFIRSLGIAVIMAQSGFFVPCSQFVFRPYTAIYSRILGNDNLFKGLSTFAVEMSELRIILKMADENSLILGDELCSGTEMESALSIFVSGLMKLHEKKCSFLFATHFHEITAYDEIRQLNHLALKHMEVTYDREQDCLVYDRKMKSGSGPSTYGLEVCKSLYLDEDFLNCAYSIRNKYYPESRGELSHPSSVYNTNKLRGKCEICGEKAGEETHHLLPQKEADADGFIGTIHKNHTANLLTVCEKCHHHLHHSQPTKTTDSKKMSLRKTKTTKGTVLTSSLLDKI